MKHLKVWLSALLTMAMLLSCSSGLAEADETRSEGSLTPGDIEASGATVYTHDGRVTFVDGAYTDAQMRSMEDAAAVVEVMIPLLGGDAKTQFEPWRTLTDASGNAYYVFQQIYADTTVSGGAVKVVANSDGTMLGLVASVKRELPDTEEAEGIAAVQAETLTIQHMLDAWGLQLAPIEGRTEKIILPVNPEPDLESEEEVEESRFVWAVYTSNPVGSVESGSELPYLAHYVSMAGEYLYCLPTILPGDEVATAGFDAAYLFEFMEPVDYTGTVTLSDGTEREITVSVMRDTRTGMYYLGNVERRIAVADCYEFLYDHGHVVLEASPDNTSWDETCLMSLYNYCRAWDYYQAIGWTGGDGLCTPMLILKDYCNSEHEPIDNAAYAGKYFGWQLFLSSAANDYSQCLDVLAHEFTHCVTGSAMTYNAYMNDYGAINEAISDIQGNLCEMMYGATEDTDWLIGESSANDAIRSMSDPHRYGQPEYTWDFHYQPNVKAPTTLNDRGGVHGNSSLLNNIAWRLCAQGGMTLEEARAFWFAVDCAMVPGTDYEQLSELMPWVLGNLGMEKYIPELEAAMDATRIRANDIPDNFDDDRALVTLTLPDTDIFMDGHWGLGIISVDVEGFAQRAADILQGNGEYASALTDILLTLYGMEDKSTGPENLDEALDALFTAIATLIETDDEEAASVEADEAGTVDEEKVAFSVRLMEVITNYFGDLFYYGTGVAGQDGRTVRLVCRPGLTLPILYRLEIDSDMKIVSTGFAVYAFGRWFDVASAAVAVLDMTAPDATEESDTTQKWLSLFDSLTDKEHLGDLFTRVTGVIKKFADPQWLFEQLFFRIERGAVSEIPANNLEAISALDVESHPVLANMLDNVLTQGNDVVTVDYGTSNLYTEDELDDAVALIEDTFATFEGCELHALRYAGDVCNSKGNIQWMNSLDDGGDYVQVAEFLSDFHSPVEGGGAWDPDTEYEDYQWWLARTKGGNWVLITWGY